MVNESIETGGYHFISLYEAYQRLLFCLAIPQIKKLQELDVLCNISKRILCNIFCVLSKLCVLGDIFWLLNISNISHKPLYSIFNILWKILKLESSNMRIPFIFQIVFN